VIASCNQGSWLCCSRSCSFSMHLPVPKQFFHIAIELLVHLGHFSSVFFFRLLCVYMFKMGYRRNMFDVNLAAFPGTKQNNIKPSLLPVYCYEHKKTFMAQYQTTHQKSHIKCTLSNQVYSKVISTCFNLMF